MPRFASPKHLLTTAIASLALLAIAPGAGAQTGLDCTGPAGDPAPGTAAWDQRESDNMECAAQRPADATANPAYQQALLDPAYTAAGAPMDPFRVPSRWAPARFRFEQVSFSNAAGKTFPALLFRPPARVRGPYPGVVITHGGAANKELHLWAAEGLAEAGYMVLAFDIPRTDSTHYEDSKTALDYFTSKRNPRLAQLDLSRIGLAGHSGGGVAVSRLGQEDKRVRTLVSWDRAQSSPMPEDLRLRTPALFLVADFNCQKSPICLPVRYDTPPDPNGPGNKDEDFQRLRAAGLDTMKVTLRAATHLDFTELPGAVASRHGTVTAFYYTLAWFDRYLRGSGSGLRRLTATRFDASADRHNISGGRQDPATGRNLPTRIAGQPVADRVSFHFRSAYFLERGRLRCESMRAGCTPPASACPAGTRLRIALGAPRGHRIVSARVYRGGRLLFTRKGKRLAAVTLSPDRTRASFQVRVEARTQRGARVITTTTYRDCDRGRTTVRVKR